MVIFIFLLIFLCQSSLQEQNKNSAMSEEEEKDPCIYTYEAFQPNLSVIKEKVALITVNRCEQQRDQARERRKRKKSKKKKQNKDSSRVLKSLEQGKSKRKKHQTLKRKRKKKKKKKKKRSRQQDRRGKVHREFQDWKRFVGTGTRGIESIKETFGKRTDFLSSLVGGSSKWRKLLKHSRSEDQPQHISHHLG